MTEELVLVEREPPVAVVLLNRPKQLNALSDELMDELVGALQELDSDDGIRCIVLGGSDRAFAAGADIGVLAQTSPYEAATSNRLGRWDSIRRIGKPIVAAVSGFCLGGGCELAMLCDLIVASETAQFGQPEINLGLMPGAGGTQRLTRAVGKAVAMDVILSGRFLSAREAQAAGLVARVVEREAWLEESKRLARADRREEPARAPPGEAGRQPRVRGIPSARRRVRAAGVRDRTRNGGRARGDERVHREATA